MLCTRPFRKSFRSPHKDVAKSTFYTKFPTKVNPNQLSDNKICLYVSN